MKYVDVIGYCKKKIAIPTLTVRSEKWRTMGTMEDALSPAEAPLIFNKCTILINLGAAPRLVTVHLYTRAVCHALVYKGENTTTIVSWSRGIC